LSFGCSAASTDIREETFTDEQITNAIETAFLTEEGVPFSPIDVEVNEGIVTLTGTVTNMLATERATAAAEITKGVRAVVNRIDVRPPPVEDYQLETDVATAIAEDPATDAYEVQVSTANGTVSLSGRVDSWQEKELAAKVAKGVRGVGALENNIEIEHTPVRSDEEIENEIKRLMQWDVRLDDALVDVKVENGIATLSGTVGSAAEKTRAMAKAWTTGVSHVDAEELEVKWWARDESLRAEKYLDREDGEIKDAVKDALLYDPRVTSFHPEVDVDSGVVTLRGVVDNLQAKQASEDDARHVVGVYSVHNLLKVRPQTDIDDDKALALDVEKALRRDVLVDQFDISVIAHNGKVDLYGVVDSELERARTVSAAARTPGVIAVDDHLRTEETTVGKSDVEIAQDIRHELFWSPFVNEDSVDVSVDGGVATLTGTVDTWWDRERAEENALDGGARAVINRVHVRNAPEYYEPTG
jgi:osmotically-inducible protein OsmY